MRSKAVGNGRSQVYEWHKHMWDNNPQTDMHKHTHIHLCAEFINGGNIHTTHERKRDRDRDRWLYVNNCTYWYRILNKCKYEWIKIPPQQPYSSCDDYDNDDDTGDMMMDICFVFRNFAYGQPNSGQSRRMKQWHVRLNGGIFLRKA